MKNQIIVRAQRAEILAQLIRTGEGAAQLCQHEPRQAWVVTVEGEGAPEIVATFDEEESATEAAEALTQQMRALIETDAQGPRLVAENGRTLQ